VAVIVFRYQGSIEGRNPRNNHITGKDTIGTILNDGPLAMLYFDVQKKTPNIGLAVSRGIFCKRVIKNRLRV